MADSTSNGSNNLNSAAAKADKITSAVANPNAMATSAGIGAATAGIGGAIASKASALPSLADISKLSSQLPGGLGDSVTKAQQLTQQMQGMKCPDFNPGMPGAAKATELEGHLNTINASAEKLNNPLGSQISGAQDALNKVKANPSAENIKNLQASTDKLKGATCANYCSDAAQKATDFTSGAEASATSAAAAAQQKAVAAAQASAKQYTDKANAMSASMLRQVNVDEAFKSSAQQSMLSQAQSMPLNMNSATAGAALSQGVSAELSKKYPNSQDTIGHVNNTIQNSTTIVSYIQTAQMAGMGSSAASQMQGQLPQTSAAGALPSNPYTNANSVIQNLSLPNCPQLSNLQSTLSGAQGNFNQALTANPVASQLQQVQGLQQQYSQLPPSTQQQIGPGNPFDAPVNCMQDNISAQQPAESPSPGLLVVAGATIGCSFLAGEITMLAPPDGVMVNKMAVAQPLDVIFAPAGMCASLGNPATASATAAALGTLVPTPCILVSAAQAVPEAWQPTTGEKYVIEEQPCLIGESCGQCIFGGKLVVVDPGQTDTVAPLGG